MRITERDLESVVARINKMTGSPATPYTRDENGKFTANVGNFHLDAAYGGWALHRMETTGGGVEVILSGYVPKRELYEKMQAFLSGLYMARQEE